MVLASRFVPAIVKAHIKKTQFVEIRKSVIISSRSTQRVWEYP